MYIYTCMGIWLRVLYIHYSFNKFVTLRKLVCCVLPVMILCPGYRVQINALTSHLDANFVYGSSFRVSDSLRLLRDGRMKTVPLFDHFNLKPLLPPKIEDPDDGCIRPHPDLFCFLAGKSLQLQCNFLLSLVLAIK